MDQLLLAQRLNRYFTFELGCEFASLFHWLFYLKWVEQPVQFYGASSIFFGASTLRR